MAKGTSDIGVFWREFRENFQTTGAILPSGRRLSRKLAIYVSPRSTPQRIVEVGPGTGVVTREILPRLGPEDTLDLVELNDRFVERLRQRFVHDPAFAPYASRVRVLHQDVAQLQPERPYDFAISGLPLNNFSVELVQQLLQVLQGLLRPGGTLSFFEYMGIRWLRSHLSGSEQRQRLRGIDAALRCLLVPHEVRRDWVWWNLPPAWVHHVRIPARSPASVPQVQGIA